jgi:hypothetical protein
MHQNASYVVAGLATCALLANGIQVAEGAPPAPKPPVKIEAIAPVNKADKPLPLNASGGWQLGFRITIEKSLGLSTAADYGGLPGYNHYGWFVFANPDAALELPCPFVMFDPFVGIVGCDDRTADETYLQFHTDVDLPGVPDSNGVETDLDDNGLSAALGNDAISGRPRFDGRDPNTFMSPIIQVFVGPDTGPDGVNDGYGLGVDDDLPGLVLLTPNGAGIVLDAALERPSPLVLRNLAGLISTVSLGLRNEGGKSFINAAGVVPLGMILPIMHIDDFYGDTQRYYRIDGGAPVIQERAAPVLVARDAYASEVNSRTYELRAFVVHGVAPFELADGDADGDVDAADATLAGYNVLSNEVAVSTRLNHPSFCEQYPNMVFEDFNGDGSTLSGEVCPPGAGAIKPIPP